MIKHIFAWSKPAYISQCSEIIFVTACICLQNTSVSPDGKSVAVLGDSADCFVADAQSGKVSYSLVLRTGVVGTNFWFSSIAFELEIEIVDWF